MSALLQGQRSIQTSNEIPSEIEAATRYTLLTLFTLFTLLTPFTLFILFIYYSNCFTLHCLKTVAYVPVYIVGEA